MKINNQKLKSYFSNEIFWQKTEQYYYISDRILINMFTQTPRENETLYKSKKGPVTKSSFDIKKTYDERYQEKKPAYDTNVIKIINCKYFRIFSDSQNTTLKNAKRTLIDDNVAQIFADNLSTKYYKYSSGIIIESTSHSILIEAIKEI